MTQSSKNILFISLPALIVCIIIIEVLLNTLLTPISIDEKTGKSPTPDPMSEWAIIDPYAAYSGKPGTNQDGKTINSEGFISTPEISRIPDSSTIRIAVLGESSSAGTGYILKDQETWPWQMSSLLDSTGIDVDYINAAMGGYTSFESYGRLWSYLRFFSPDIVIVNHGWNEMYYFTDNKGALRKPGWDLHQAIEVPVIERKPLDDFMGWSQIYCRIRIMTTSPELSGERGKGREKLASNFNRKAIQIWKENLILIRNYCQLKNIKLYVFKQPTLITENATVNDRERCKVHLHGFDFDTHLKAYQAIYDVIDDIIDESMIIDGSAISGESKYFYDHVHPTPEGAKMIAKLAVNKLLETQLTTK